MNPNYGYNYSNPSFIFQELIGSGTFGNVYKAYDMNTSRVVAIKRTQKKGSIVSREFKILQEVRNCEFCVELFDIFYTINSANELIQHLVFEYMPTSLGRVIRYNYTDNKKRMSHEEIVCICKQILLGLSYLHKRQIIHRDIKPDNILMSTHFPYTVKICDFGSAKKISNPSTPYIVSRFYRAPELIFCMTDYGCEVDIWAVGCVLLELYTGFPIFRGHNDGDQFIQIARILGPPSKSDIEALASTKISTKLISKATAIGNKQNILELFGVSPKPKTVEDLILGMLQWDPKKRLKVDECLSHQFFT